MALPNPLASRWGRLIAFFFLYVTEGIPLGFTATTMAVQMKRAGVGEKEIGLFVGSLYLPWAFKWAMGPVVDLVYSNKLGARRGWILGTQIMMALTLLYCMPIELTPENLGYLTVVIMIHNTFCATQDVAIDALACKVLHEDERGLANGLMFAGQTLGIPLGGACVLYLIDGISWLPGFEEGIKVQTAYWFVIACILVVTVFIAVPMREETRERPPHDGTPVQAIIDEMWQYLKTAFKSFFGSRLAFFSLLFALLPPGAVGLNLALQKTVAVEVGFTDSDVADLEIVSSIFWSVMCVLGGLISDRLGHLKCLAVFLALISLPTFWCAWQMNQEGYVLPKSVLAEQAAAEQPADNQSAEETADVTDEETEEKKPDKTSVFDRNPVDPMAGKYWWAVMAYMGFQGLMYGTRIAVFMRIANPDVAATQFTAYMAMMNLVTAYTAWWQGITIEEFGYPTTLVIDGILGLVCIALIPFLRERPKDRAQSDDDESGEGSDTSGSPLALSDSPDSVSDVADGPEVADEEET